MILFFQGIDCDLVVVFGFRIFKKMHVTMKNDSHHEPLNNLPSMSHETSKFEGGA